MLFRHSSLWPWLRFSKPSSKKRTRILPWFNGTLQRQPVFRRTVTHWKFVRRTFTTRICQTRTLPLRFGSSVPHLPNTICIVNCTCIQNNCRNYTKELRICLNFLLMKLQTFKGLNQPFLWRHKNGFFWRLQEMSSTTPIIIRQVIKISRSERIPHAGSYW